MGENLSRSQKLNKQKKRRKRMVAVLVMGAMIFGSAPIMAKNAGNTPKEEVVYVNLASDGSVESIYIVNSFEINESGQILDYGAYSAVRNMSTNDAIIMDEETIKIDTNAKKLYYEGKVDQDTLPWNFDVHYYLDGTEMTAEDVYGQSGKLKIVLQIAQNVECRSSFFENYSLQTTIELDSETCHNIETEDATVANVGKKRQYLYTILPNKGKTISLSADVQNFTMPAISINGVILDMDIDVDTDANADINRQINDIEDAVADIDDGVKEAKEATEELQDSALELKDGAIELNDGVKELKDGGQEMVDGSADLVDGAKELADGSKKLTEGSNELLDGSEELKDGAKELNSSLEKAKDGALELCEGLEKLENGANKVKNGSKDLRDGLDELSGKNAELTAGSEQVFDRLLAEAQSSLNGQLTAMGMAPVSLTKENYSVILDGLLNEVTNGAYSQGGEEAASRVRAEVQKAVKQGIEEQIRNDEDTMAQINAAIDSQYQEEILATAQNYVATEFAKVVVGNEEDAQAWLASQEGQETLAVYIVSEEGQAACEEVYPLIRSQYIEAAITQQSDAYMESEEGKALVEAKLNEYLQSEEGQSTINQQIEAALQENASYQALVELKKQLDEYNRFYFGIKEYTEAVSEASNGAEQIYDGAWELQNGATRLYNGADELYLGLHKMKNGTADLVEGSISLHDGVVELRNGILELNDGSLELLNGAVELNSGAVDLYDGIVTLNDGTIELLDGTVKLYDGTVELHDGIIELKDGTWEFRERTSNLDEDLKDKISKALKNTLRGNGNILSFASDKNTNIDSLQFVMQIQGVQAEEDQTDLIIEEPKLNFWQKLLRLFGLY